MTWPVTTGIGFRKLACGPLRSVGFLTRPTDFEETVQGQRPVGSYRRTEC
jgi:hypothetical protein